MTQAVSTRFQCLLSLPVTSRRTDGRQQNWISRRARHVRVSGRTGALSGSQVNLRPQGSSLIDVMRKRPGGGSCARERAFTAADNSQAPFLAAGTTAPLCGSL